MVQQKIPKSTTLAYSIPVLSRKETIAFAPLSSVTREEMIVIFTTRLVSHIIQDQIKSTYSWYTLTLALMEV